MTTIVVGAGVMGLATAWHLARADEAVTLLERGPIPNPLAASWDSHRLIRALYPGSPGYTRMAIDAFAAWDEVWQAAGVSHYANCGSIAFSRAEGDWTDGCRAPLDALGAAYELVPPEELARRYPFLIPDGIRWGLFMPEGGVLFADRILSTLVDLCRAAGVALRPQAPVRAVDPDGTVTLESGEVLQADSVVVAAGAWVGGLFPDVIGKRLNPYRQVVVYLDPPAEVAEAWARAPGIIDCGFPDAHWGIPPVGGTRLKLAVGDWKRRAEPGLDPAVGAGEAEAIRERWRPVLRDIDRYAILEARSCRYIFAPDDRFVLERRGRAWLVSPCSGHGFKFGALIGRAVADGVRGRRGPDELASWAAGHLPAGHLAAEGERA
ncbi:MULTISPECIES: NAD(P)/FAD-dependent oxidoreductase [Inquilinus]|uniref:Sarcosine oxidase n=1 Tax=Inquilinus ginsengisoli TaxID=363840 RepID=A0ABU1JVD0_9PROT|nr:FAD-dependent oxidoreductase [Inquilinus ginsengisoli]MDR6291510.1 sarcosine oxidase [Inquilinus ginsengisoli]